MKKKSFLLACFLPLLVACKEKHVLELVPPIPSDSISLLESDLPNQHYNDLFFVNDSTGFIVGNDGAIMKTSNTGKNWVQIQSNTQMPLHSVQFWNDSTGFIIGQNTTGVGGIILKTKDGGKTWNKLIEGTIEPRNICFASNTSGYILMAFDKLLKTVDAGQTWEAITLPNGIRPYGINFRNPSNGYMAAANGIFYITKDGGHSWNNFTTSTGGNLYNVIFAGENTVLKGDGKIVVISSDDTFKIQTIPDTEKLVFINEKSVGIGFHYPDQGFYPNGDIYISNDFWKTWSKASYGGSVAVTFTALGKIGLDKIMIIGSGFNGASIFILKV